MNLRMGEITITHNMLLAEGVEETIIEIDLLRRMGVKIDLEKNQLKVGQQTIGLGPSKNCPSVVRGATAASVPECPVIRVNRCIQQYTGLFSTSNNEYSFVTGWSVGSTWLWEECVNQ